MGSSVITYAKRTAVAKVCGGFATTEAPQLGAQLVKDALKELKLDASAVTEIIMGQVLSAGAGQAPARQAAIYGGLSDSVCALTINKVCGSGLKSVMLADQTIRLDEAKTIFAGGQESMTSAPHILKASRQGFRFGDTKLIDSMQYDGLTDPYDSVAMGVCGEHCAQKYSFSREEQDQFALLSYKKAQTAVSSGTFSKEILPVSVKSRKKELIIDKDEEPFSVDLDRLPSLRPAFDVNGTITAGNASSINDGAALLVVEDSTTQRQPLAKILGHCSVAAEPKWFTTAPIAAIQKVLTKTGLSTADISFFEINEAFAVVTMAAIKELSLDPEKVNPRGGAVSIGHPIGASGARILVTLIHSLEKGQKGLATLCIGGGEACAMVIERC